jgi:hypothetical protein
MDRLGVVVIWFDEVYCGAIVVSNLDPAALCTTRTPNQATAQHNRKKGSSAAYKACC